MKILAISDIHSAENDNLIDYIENNDIDLVIISGDVTDFGPLEFVDTFIKKIIDCNCDVVAVPGNCDPNGVCNAIKKAGAICTHNKVISFDDFLIFGYGGSNPTPFNTPGEVEDTKIHSDIYNLINEYERVSDPKINKFKILLTHAPPFNTAADLIDGGDHVGSQAIRQIIENFKIDINICGHIHEAKSIDKVGITTVINPGMLQNNGAALITIDNIKNYNTELVLL